MNKSITFKPENFDWKTLRSQKAVLVNLVFHPGKHRLSKVEAGKVEAILAVIDSIQDKAVDMCGLPEREVFGRLSR